jgi:F0F1-type ATP synthase membrane subunit b/b'
LKPSAKAFATKHNEIRKSAGEAAGVKARADALAQNAKDPGHAKSNAEIDVLVAKAIKEAEEKASVGSKTLEMRA